MISTDITYQIYLNMSGNTLTEMLVNFLALESTSTDNSGFISPYTIVEYNISKFHFVTLFFTSSVP